MLKRCAPLLAFACLMACATLSAQPLIRSPWPLTFQAQGLVQHYQADGSSLWGAAQANGNGHYQLNLGYEQLLKPKWLLGASYQQAGKPQQWGLQGYLRHNGRIGKLVFLKEFAIARTQEKASGSGNWVFGGMAYIGHRFRMAGKPWQAGFAVDASKIRDVPGDPRRISRSQWTASLDCGLGSAIALRLLAGAGTAYYFGLAQERYDSQGNLIESIPYHRLNKIQPYAGAGIRLLLKAGHQHEEAPFNLWKPTRL